MSNPYDSEAGLENVWFSKACWNLGSQRWNVLSMDEAGRAFDYLQLFAPPFPEAEDICVKNKTKLPICLISIIYLLNIELRFTWRWSLAENFSDSPWFINVEDNVSVIPVARIDMEYFNFHFKNSPDFINQEVF